MWVYFDENGAILTALEHGSPARQGTTYFEINAYFDLYSEDIDSYEGILTLQKPSILGHGYEQIDQQFDMIITKNKLFAKTNNETDQSIFPFKNLRQYNVFSFNFHHDAEGDLFETKILDTPGLWQAIIDIYDATTHEHRVMGRLSFNVQPGVFVN